MQTSRRLLFIFALFQHHHRWAGMTQTPGTRDAPLCWKGNGVYFFARPIRPTFQPSGKATSHHGLAPSSHSSISLSVATGCY